MDATEEYIDRVEVRVVLALLIRVDQIRQQHTKEFHLTM